MNKLERIYVVMCLAVTGLFGVGAHYGVKAGPPFPTSTSGGHAYSPAAHGVYYWGGGGTTRSSGGSWGGGK
jgi:hypothetical protein